MTKKLEDLIPAAIETIEYLLKSENEKIQLQAAQEIFKYSSNKDSNYELKYLEELYDIKSEEDLAKIITKYG